MPRLITLGVMKKILSQRILYKTHLFLSSWCTRLVTLPQNSPIMNILAKNININSTK